MTAENEDKACRVSRRKVLIATIAGTAAVATGAYFAKRGNWAKRIASLLHPTPPVELTFTGPFENEKPLLDKPVENDWVCVEKAYFRNLGSISSSFPHIWA